MISVRLTSSGKNVFASPWYSTLILGLDESLIISKGQCFMSAWTVLSSNLRPISRLASEKPRRNDNETRMQDIMQMRTSVMYFGDPSHMN